MRVEVDEIPKGLNEEDQPRLATGQRRGVGIGEKIGSEGGTETFGGYLVTKFVTQL